MRKHRFWRKRGNHFGHNVRWSDLPGYMKMGIVGGNLAWIYWVIVAICCVFN